MTIYVRTDRNLTPKRFAQLGLPQSDFHRIIVWEQDDNGLKTILDICEPISSIGRGPKSVINFFNRYIRPTTYINNLVSIEVRQADSQGR